MSQCGGGFPLHGLSVAQSDEHNIHCRLWNVQGNHKHTSRTTSHFFVMESGWCDLIKYQITGCLSSRNFSHSKITVHNILNSLTEYCNRIEYFIHCLSPVIHHRALKVINILLSGSSCKTSRRWFSYKILHSDTELCSLFYCCQKWSFIL